MLNPNTNARLTFEEKRNCTIDGQLYMPAVVSAYDPDTDSYTVAADERYVIDGLDSDFIDFDDMQVPALLIPTITGGFDPNSDSDDPLRFVGLYLCLNF